MMKIRFWGCRGSIPTPGPETVQFGGNTSCVSLEIEGRTIIFDAGSGIRPCGNDLLSRGGPINASILISHTHWDHIQGFPFFVPAYIPGNHFRLYGPPSDIQDRSLRQIMELQTNYEVFPIHIDQLGADIEYIDCREGEMEIGGVLVRTIRLNHPVACLAYRIEHLGKVYVYGGDHEPFRNVYRDGGHEGMDEDFLRELDENAEEQNQRIVEFLRDADVISWDSTYTTEEYKSKLGWGHSTYESNLDLAVAAGVKHMICTHHDPATPDSVLVEREAKYKAMAEERGFRLDFAREGLEIDLA